MTDLPEWIKGLREACRLNQEQFADLADVTQGTVSRWEKGAEVKRENLDRLEELAIERDYPLFRVSAVRKQITGLLIDLESVEERERRIILNGLQAQINAAKKKPVAQAKPRPTPLKPRR